MQQLVAQSFLASTSENMNGNEYKARTRKRNPDQIASNIHNLSHTQYTIIFISELFVVCKGNENAFKLCFLSLKLQYLS